jgi:hypothetical protein
MDSEEEEFQKVCPKEHYEEEQSLEERSRTYSEADDFLAMRSVCIDL